MRFTARCGNTERLSKQIQVNAQELFHKINWNDSA